MGKREKLDASIDTYLRALRHKDENVVIVFAEPENRDAFARSYSKLQNYYFSNAEVGTIFPDESNDQAIATLLFEYFDPSGTNLMRAKTQLTWKYSQTADAWLIQGASPLGQITQ